GEGVGEGQVDADAGEARGELDPEIYATVRRSQGRGRQLGGEQRVALLRLDLPEETDDLPVRRHQLGRAAVEEAVECRRTSFQADAEGLAQALQRPLEVEEVKLRALPAALPGRPHGAAGDQGDRLRLLREICQLALAPPGALEEDAPDLEQA